MLSVTILLIKERVNFENFETANVKFQYAVLRR